MRILGITLLLAAASCSQEPTDPHVVADRAIVEGIDVESFAGRSLAVLGDLDGDGTTEVAVAAYRKVERPREVINSRQGDEVTTPFALPPSP